MPQLIPAAAAAWAGSAAAAAGWSAFAVSVTQFAVAVVVSQVVQKTLGESGTAAQQRGTQTVLRSAVEAQRIIYGERVVSGPLVFSRVSRDTARTTESHAVPAGTLQVRVDQGAEFRGNVLVFQIDPLVSDTGVYLETFFPYTQVASSPGPLQYSVDANGVYTFNSAQAGVNVGITYEHGGDINQNSWLHMVIPLAYHQVEEISDVYFNSDVIAASDLNAAGDVVSGKYANYAKIRKYLGAPGQAADGYLQSVSLGQWTSQHVGEGVAYLVVSLRRNLDVYSSGVPNVRAKVKGALLYDPRTGLTQYSNNWALVVRDYLTRAEGLGCDASEIDDDLVSAAANVSDEDVDLDGVGTTQKRYTADGIVTLDAKPIDTLQEILSAGAGVAVYSVSTWDIYAGAYVPPTRTVTVSDLRDEISGAPDLPRRDIFNAVRGTFVDPDTDWQATSFPPVTNPTYEAEDGGEQIPRDIQLPFTTNAVRAQRLAKIVLERARQGATLAWPGKLSCFRLNTWETVNVEVAQLGYSPKVFRVNAWQWQPGAGVDLALQEEAAAAYDWNYGEATTYDLAQNTALPLDGPLIPPGAPQVSEELYETRDARGLAARAILQWVRSPDAYVTGYQAEYKLSAELVWLRLPATISTGATVEDIAPGIYDFRVRAFDELGRASIYSQTTKEILGLTAPPSTPTGLTIQAGGGTARLRLDPAPELDVRRGGRILVKFCHENVTPAEWGIGFSIGDPLGYPGDATIIDLPLKPGTYMVKFEDSTGHESAAWAEIATKQASVLSFSTLDEITFSPDFMGTHSGTAVVDGQLGLGGTGFFDDIADFDAVSDLDGYGGIASTGTWTADTGIDFGSVTACRITSHLEGAVDNVLDQIDDRADNVDDWLDWDGDQLGGSAADAYCEARETDDDPAGSPSWSEWKRLDSAEFVCRALQFRAVLNTLDTSYRPLVSHFSVKAEEIV